MALDDVYQLTATQIIAGKEVANTFYYVETVLSAGDPLANAGAISREFFTQIWQTWWDNLVSPDVELTALFTARIHPVVNPAVSVFYTGEHGTRGGDALPNGSAVLVSAHDTTNSPNFRRRFYFAGLPESDAEDSGLTDSILLAWDLFAFQLETLVLAPASVAPAAFTPCAFSKKRVADATPPYFALLSTSRVTQNIRSQRQRNPRILYPSP